MKNVKETGRTGNVKRNILYGWLQLAVGRALPFIVRTVVIYRFGVEYIGLNSLFSSVLSVLSLMELGFGTAVVYSMYKPAAEGNTAEIGAWLAYYRRIYRFIGLAVLAAGLAVMPALDRLIRDSSLPGGLNLHACYLIFLGSAALSYLLFGYMSAVPAAYQRRDLLSRARIGTDIFGFILKCAVLLTFTDYYPYLLTIPVITAAHNLIVAYTVRRRYPDLRCRGEISPEQKRDLRRKVYGILVNKLTNVSRNSIDSLCVSAVFGLAAAGIYNNYYFIMSAVLSVSVTICNSMMASVGNSVAKESREKNYADMRLFDCIFMALAGWSVTCLLCLYQPFVTAWAGEKMTLGMPAVAGLCLYFYILAAGAIRWVYHEGAGLWWECRHIMIGEAAANIVLNIVLCRMMGIAGIVLATVLTVFATNCVLCPELIFRLYFRNGKLREYWADHLSYAGTTLLSAGSAWLVCESILPTGMAAGRTAERIVCLGGRLVLCSALFAALYWMIWHRSERYAKAAEWFRRFRKA